MHTKLREKTAYLKQKQESKRGLKKIFCSLTIETNALDMWGSLEIVQLDLEITISYEVC